MAEKERRSGEDRRKRSDRRKNKDKNYIEAAKKEDLN